MWDCLQLKKNFHCQSSEEKTGLVEEQIVTGDKAYEQLTVSSLSKAGKRHRLDEDFKEEETKTDHLSHQNFILYMEKVSNFEVLIGNLKRKLQLILHFTKDFQIWEQGYR